jgi:hypothetical protein
LRTPYIQPNAYFIGANHGQLDYRIWDHKSGALRTDSAVRITGSFSLRNVRTQTDPRRKFGGWEADITVRQ